MAISHLRPCPTFAFQEFAQCALEAAGIQSICVNFTVFSFVMTYNNKKVGAILLFCLKPVPLIDQILNIKKYLHLSESILCVSQMKDS